MNTPASDFIALFVQDVSEFPEAYKAAVKLNPRGHAAQIIDGLSDREIVGLLNDLHKERKRIAAL